MFPRPTKGPQMCANFTDRFQSLLLNLFSKMAINKYSHTACAPNWTPIHW